MEPSLSFLELMPSKAWIPRCVAQWITGWIARRPRMVALQFERDIPRHAASSRPILALLFFLPFSASRSCEDPRACKVSRIGKYALQTKADGWQEITTRVEKSICWDEKGNPFALYVRQIVLTDSDNLHETRSLYVHSALDENVKRHGCSSLNGKCVKPSRNSSV